MSATAEVTATQPGLYPGISRAEYESIEAVNVSKLERFERSAAHAREAIIHPPLPTEAMDFGTAVHCAILEPHRFSELYVAAPKVDRRTNVGKIAWAEFEAAHAGAILMDAGDFVAASRMRDAAWADETAKGLLGGQGHNEVAVVWRHAETGLLCKGLIDRIGAFDGWTWVTDVKTTADARHREFTGSIKTYHYGAKAAFYLDGCATVAPRDRRFAWIAVEKTAPYAVKVYEADASALATGRSKYSRWLRLYDEAVRTGLWPAYESGIQSLSSEETEWHS